MLDVPPHLLQPLFVNTNISYDLDMSKFPGLDDPQQMYQPALLIATDWNDYINDDVVTDGELSSDSLVFEDDLFSLIESCDLTLMETDATTQNDDDTFHSFLDDIITDAAAPFDDIDELLEIHDSTSYCEAPNTLGNASNTVDTPSIFTSGVRGQKRRRPSDSDYKYSKKSKMVDNVSLRLPALVSLCPTSNQCAMHRDS